MKKPFKDWGIVNFFQDKVPQAAGNIVGEISDVILRGESPVKAVADIISGGKGRELSPEDKERALEIAKQDFEREKEYLQDIQDSRSMHETIATSLNATRLSKNFIYYFAIGIALSMLLIIVLLFFIELPDDNKRIVDMILGAFVGILVSVGTFFYGSSMGSKNKESTLSGIANKIKRNIGD